MGSQHRERQDLVVGKRRRWFLGLEPIFEGGRRGEKAREWEVEDELIAVAVLGDVTIDLSQTKSAPAQIVINAYAIFRDVDVRVAEGAYVQLFGGVWRGQLKDETPAVPEELRRSAIRIHGHSFLGDVTVRSARAER